MTDKREDDTRVNRPQRQLLVVDDQVAIRQLLKEALTQQGYQVAMAANGKEALNTALDLKPDLVLLDLKMPGELNGLQTVTALGEHGLKAEVVVMTAYSELVSCERARQLGVKHFLSKPFSLDELLAVVASALGGGAGNSKPI